MPQLYARLVSFCFVLLVAPMLIIRAQPYHNPELRALLMPEGCDKPCLMGIKPGVTTLDEAMQMLQATGWVKNVRFQSQTTVTSSIVNGSGAWEWNDSFPFLPRDRSSRLVNILYTRNNVVNTISVFLSFRFGDFWMEWNPPTHYRVWTENDVIRDRVILLYAQVYSEMNLRVGSTTICPYFSGIWSRSSSVLIGDLTAWTTPNTDRFFTRTIAQLNHITCGR